MPNAEARRMVASPAAGDAVGRVEADGRRLVDAATPWYLDAPDAAWVVRSGRVDLFAISTHSEGRRIHLISVDEGATLGGAQDTEDGQYAVLAVGIPGTVIEEWPVQEIAALTGPDGQPLAAWVSELMSERRNDETHRVGSLRVLDDEALDRAETLLDGVARPTLTLTTTDDDVVAAVTALAESEGLAPPVDVGRSQTGDLLDRVQALTSTMHARGRDVRLDPGWWLSPGDGFIAADADGHALAILPSPRRRVRSTAGHRELPYVVVRAGSPLPVLLDPDTAAGIALNVVVLQRVLPASPRRVRDLVHVARRSVRGEVAWMGVLAVAASLMGVLVPITLGKVVSSAVPNRQQEAVIGLVVMLFAAGFASFVFDVVRSLTLLRLSGEYDRNLLPAVWDRVLRLPARFFRDYNVGDLASRIVGVDVARQALSDVIVIGALATATLVVNALLMLAIAPKLAIPSLIVIAVFAGITMSMTRSADRFGRLALTSTGHKQAMSLQLVKGVAKIRVAGATATMFARWAELLSATSQYRQSRALRSSVVTVAGGALALAASAAAYAAAVVMGDDVSLTIFAVYAAALGLAVSAATTLAMSVGTVPTIRALFDRAAPILAAPTEDAKPGRPLEIQGAISFRNLHFTYPGQSVNVLDGFSLDIAPGSFTAIVGPSGCGKSTVLRCLMGFEHPQSGTVLLDDHDLGELDLAHVRRQFGVVLQQFQVMGGTVFENIVGPRPLTEDDAWAAAEKVGLADFIHRLPMGMRTLIVDGAGTFSGGQAQRLMLARAVASEPTIIVLDEATSALDNPTQEIVARSLAELSSTRVVIAHRLSTIRLADQIAVMDRGRVAELGRHDELMAAGGRYAALVRRQL